MSKKEERQNKIYNLLTNNEKLSVSELAKQLAVTPETIRTDLDALEKNGLITRGHGYARAVRNFVELPFDQRRTAHLEDKKAVAWRAIAEIEDGMTVFLDTGTTLFSGLDLLKSKRDLTIVTNSLAVAEMVRHLHFKILLVGGDLLGTGMRCVGFFAEQMIEQIHFNLAILGTDGLKDMEGFGVWFSEEIGWERKVIENADRTILIADASKFEHYSMYRSATLEEVDLLITNFVAEEIRDQVTQKIRLIETDGQNERDTPKKNKGNKPIERLV